MKSKSPLLEGNAKSTLNSKSFHRRTVSSLTTVNGSKPVQLKSNVVSKKNEIFPIFEEKFPTRSKNRHNTQLVPNITVSSKSSPDKKDLSRLAFDDDKVSITFSKCESCSKTIEKPINDPILAALESFQNLRYEARSCLDNSKRLIQVASKSRRASVASDDFRMLSSLNTSEFQVDPLRELAESIQDIRSRLAIAEAANHIQVGEEKLIKEVVENIGKKISGDEMVLDSTSTKVGCNAACTVI